MAICIAPTRAIAQTTRPAQDGKILVLPFMAINPAENQAWLGRSIQQSLAADLTPAAPGRVISVDQEARDTDAAVAAGRKAEAAYVVTGSFTSISTSAGQGLRLMGQIIDSHAGAPVGAFKATGMSGEVFRLEDQIGAQIRHELASTGAIAPPPVVEAPPAQNESNQQVTGVYQQPNPYYQEYGTPQVYTPGETNYNYYYSNPGYGGYYGGYYPYGYGGYGWGWPYWWGGAVIIGNGHFHDHDHFHGGGHFGGVGGGHFGGGGAHFGGGGAHFGGGMHVGGMGHAGGGGHR